MGTVAAGTTGVAVVPVATGRSADLRVVINRSLWTAKWQKTLALRLTLAVTSTSAKQEVCVVAERALEGIRLDESHRRERGEYPACMARAAMRAAAAREAYRESPSLNCRCGYNRKVKSQRLRTEK